MKVATMHNNSTFHTRKSGENNIMKNLATNKTKIRVNEKDKCVFCGKETGYDSSTPIYVREYYIECAGQLCEECYFDIYGEADK